MDLYLLPGLGADHRIFQGLHFPGHQVHFLDHPTMPRGSALSDYAAALAPLVDTSQRHALIGVSMGGMVAQELAGLTGAQRTVIISSWKGPQEMPPSIRLLRGTHPERMLSKVFIQRTLPFVRWQMGIEDPAEVAMFDQLVAVHTAEQMKVQINACLMWDGPITPVKDLLHIHGDQDRLMPIAHIKAPIIIKGGGHFMVVTKAEDVRRAIGLL